MSASIVSRATPTKILAAPEALDAIAASAAGDPSDDNPTVIMTADPVTEAKAACLVVERRSAKGPRERHVFVPGRVRLAVPVQAAHGSSPPKTVAYLLYDGEHLEVSAALADVPVMIAGMRVGGSWRRVPVPSVVRIGDEELQVRGAEPRAFRPKGATMMVDLDVDDARRTYDSEATIAAPMTRASSKRMLARTIPRSSTPATPIQVSREQLVQAASVPPLETTLVPTSPSTRRELEAKSRRGDSAKPTSKRRRVVMAIASGAISAALTTLLLVGGASKGAVPRTRTAMAKESPRAGDATTPASSVATAPAASSAPLPSPAPAKTAAAAVPDAPAREGTTTLERQAIDLFARGAFTEAAAVYRELARQHPERRVFADAATIAESRANKAIE